MITRRLLVGSILLAMIFFTSFSLSVGAALSPFHDTKHGAKATHLKGSANLAEEWKQICCEAPFLASNTWYSPIYYGECPRPNGGQCICEGKSGSQRYFAAMNFYIAGQGGAPLPIFVSFDTEEQPHIFDDICENSTYTDSSPLLYIYDTEFTPANPCHNLVAITESGRYVDLVPNNNYIFVAKSYTRNRPADPVRFAIRAEQAISVQCIPYTPATTTTTSCAGELALTDVAIYSKKLSDLWGNVDGRDRISHEYASSCLYRGSSDTSIYHIDAYNFHINSTSEENVSITVEEGLSDHSLFLLLFKGSFHGDGFCDGDEYVAHHEMSDSRYQRLRNMRVYLDPGSYTLVVTHYQPTLLYDIEPDVVPYRLLLTHRAG